MPTSEHSAQAGQAHDAVRGGSSAGASGAQPEAALPNPFPGLRAYGPDEAHLFFGREEHVEALLHKLAVHRFSAVIGLSGSGKSSLVLAGALPRLRRGYRTRTTSSKSAPVRSSWRVAQMRPGSDPLKSLAAALWCVAQPEADGDEQAARAGTLRDGPDEALELSLLEAQLDHSQNGLIGACETLALEPHENLLIVVDQFEELFRFRELSRARNAVVDPAAAFVQLLLRATEQERLPIYVVLTLRSEFIGECCQLTGLAEAVNEGQYLLPLLSRDQREQAIRGPMSVVGARIAPALVQRILNDAGDMTDQLPVLQHALTRSFELWQSAPTRAPELQLAHYEAAGGMKGALSQHADEALREVEAELGAEGLRVTQRLFRCLTDPGPHGRGVRRPCRVSEVLAVADTDVSTLRKIVARFAGLRSRAEPRASTKQPGFLVVQPAERELSPDSLLDISHEALMRQWGRLESWTSAEQAFASQLSYLREAVQKRDQGRAGLWRDPELSLAIRWKETERPSSAAAMRYGVDLERVDAFLRESEEARAAAVATERDAQVWRRFRKIFTETKRGTLVSLLAMFLMLALQGSGLLDSFWPWSTRLKLLSVSARYLGVERVLDGALGAIVIDEQTVSKLRDRLESGERLGSLGTRWRTLQAEALTRLTDAGAKVVVFDVEFGSFRDAQERPRTPSPLEQSGTEAFAAAIQRARKAGTAVVIAAGAKSPAGALDSHPLLAQALRTQGPADAPYALGSIASACIAFAERGAAVFMPLLTIHPQRPHHPGLALAALSGLWDMPNLVIDRSARTLFLAGGGQQRDIPFAGLGRTLQEGEKCPTFIAGDVPAQQIVDLSAAPVRRGNPAVVPFEDLLTGPELPSLAGKIVMVGAQLRDASGKLVDGHRVLQCGATPWSCEWTSRWGMALHLDALSNLLQGRAIRPIGPIEQLLMILVLCGVVAWLRVQNRDKQPWQRRAALAGVVAVDLLLVAGAAILGDILMDEAYHVMAMVGTHLIVGRLDKH